MEHNMKYIPFIMILLMATTVSAAELIELSEYGHKQQNAIVRLLYGKEFDEYSSYGGGQFEIKYKIGIYDLNNDGDNEIILYLNTPMIYCGAGHGRV